jgi:uncharacterized damage-inducible protein DinB
MEYRSLLEEALESWEGVREGLIAELELVPAEKYDFRPAPEAKSVGELAVHLLESGAMMVGELTRADTHFKRLPFPELMAHHAGALSRLTGKEELMAALERELDRGLEAFAAVGELHMLQLIERFDGKKGTRLAWLQHGIDHETYHRGQVTVYERLLGLEPALTRQIRQGS